MKKIALSLWLLSSALSLTAMDDPGLDDQIVGSSTVGVGEVISSSAGWKLGKNADVHEVNWDVKKKEELKTKYKAAVDNLLTELRSFNAAQVKKYLLTLSNIDKNDTLRLWSNHSLEVTVVAKIAYKKANTCLKKYMKEYKTLDIEYYQETQEFKDVALKLTLNAENAKFNKELVKQYNADHNLYQLLSLD